MRAAIALLALAVAVSAQGGLGGLGGRGDGRGDGGLGGGWGWGHDSWAHPHYKYSYGVSDKHTGDVKNAQEVRDGDVTKGSYSLVQPDGVIRTVTYISTPHGGFQAQVHNKGVAGHPGGWGWGAGRGAGLGGVGGVIG